MKPLFWASVFCLVALSLSMTKKHSPQVQVYSRDPGFFGKPNIIICHVTGFYPPQIKIEIVRNGAVIGDTRQTDLAFEETWQYYLTKHANFTPTARDTYSCRVTHIEDVKEYIWEPDM